ncbi:VapE domain-containing protein [Symbiopectobacterium sp.]|uniref:VapE domain-containing protein n=1 Tax=Symbiopectobacterium sp. TaxID=2952789 RepID=UPI003F32E993
MGLHASDVRPKPGVCENFRRFSDTLEDLRTAIGISQEDTRAQMYAKKARLPYIWHSMKDVVVGRYALNAGDRDVLFLDMDGCDEEAWRALRDALACFSCFTYSTPSHLHPTVKGEQRWRICMELDRSVTPEEYKCLGPAVENWLMDRINLLDDYPVRWDRSVYNPDHMLYGPDENAIFDRFSGTPVTVDILLARAGDLPICPVSDHSGDDLSRLVDLNNVTQETFDDLRSAMWHPPVLADAQPECSRHNAWASMGCRLAWFIGTEFENQARELWLEWSVAGGGSAADIAEAKRRWDEGKLVADRTGYQAIFTRAQKEGWINPGAERMRLSSAASVEDFEDLTSTEVAEPAPLPPFRRDNKGAIEAIIDNVALALLRPTFMGVEIRYDIFRDAIMLAPKGTNGWRAFGDEDYSELRVILSRRSFKEVNKELMRDAVFMVAKRQPFDSATTWLNGLEWDGVPRIEYFYHTHFGTADTPYTRAVSMYMWTALAGRVLEPGIKADMVPILVGAQGLRKSAGIAALSPDPEFFADISFADKDDDLARKMRGCLVAEISELRGLNTKDLESIKAWVTRTHDKWVPKFREFTTTFARRGIPLGSSNEDEFLADKTGNRRWLPVDVVEMVDTDAIARNRELLWAEARETFKHLGGIQFCEAERLGASVHEQYTIKDAWLETVEKWLDTPDLMTNDIPRNCEFLRTSDVLRDAIGLNPSHIGKREEMRISNVLQNCGYKRVQRRVDGKVLKVWTAVYPPVST